MTIYQAIAEIMRETDAIGKDRKNTQQNYSFRGIDDVYNAVHPLFAKHGVFSVPQVIEDRTEERTTKNGSALIYRVLKIKYTFYAADGSFIEAAVIGEGMDSGDKASNKAMAVAHKYAILQILSIPTEEEKDPEITSHDIKPKTDDGKKQLLNRIGEIVSQEIFTDAERNFYRELCKGKDAEGLKKVLADAGKSFAAKEYARGESDSASFDAVQQEVLF
jgi:hypothetical protein